MDTSLALTLLVLSFVLLLVAAAVAAVVVVTQRRRREQGLAERARTVDPMAAGPMVSDPRRLKPGDIVRISAEPGDWVVRGTLAFDEDGYRWKEHLLDGSTAAGDRRHWLSVEEGESGLELVLWDRLPGSDLTPDLVEVAHDGVAYRRDERGRARYRVERVGDAAGESGTVEYADYVAGERLLAFERYGTGSWEVSEGKHISEHVLDVYPRSA